MASRPDPRVTTLLNQQSAVSQGLFDRIVTLIRRLFGAAGPSDWYSEKWVTTTADQLSRSSRTVQVAQANTTGRVLDLVAQQYGKPTTGRVTLPDNLRQGVTPEDVWRRPAEQYRYAASQGAEPAQALKVATQRAVALADTDRQLADRWAAREKLQLPEITGYRRIIHPELSVSGVCGLCVVAADRIYHVEELRAIHDRCKCTTLPIYEDNDPGLSLNQQDLAEIYRAAGSTGAADLKRVRMKVEEHGELGPVLRVQGQKFRDKEDVADDRTRIDEAERTLADLLARQAAGEALEPQIAYQRRLITRLGKKKP